MAEQRNYIGVAMGLDVTELKAGLADAERQIKLANSEFKSAASGMEDWQKSTEGLSAKLKQLDTVLDAQKRKLAGLEAEYEKVAAEQGDNSEAAQRLRIQINNQQSVVNKTQREFDNYTKTLKDAKAGVIDLEKVTLRGGKAVEKLSKDVKDSGDGFTVAKGAIAGFIANGLTALVGACKNAITSVLGLADATREYRRTMATLDVAAQDVGVSTDYIRDKFVEMSGVFEDQDSITEGLNNLLTAGFDETSLDTITQSLEGAALKWKDTLKFEGLADSLQEWIGSGGENLSGNFAELLERMGYNLDEVKAKTAGMTDEQRRNYAANLLNSEGLAEVSANYREQNKDMVAAQEANANYQNSVATMGAIIEPITTKIREGFTRIVDKLIELTQNIDFAALGASIDAAFTTFINDILPKIISGLQWLIDNFDLIIAGVVGIGAAFLAWKVVGIITAVTKALNGMTIAQYALNLAMNLNPIGIIITLIAGLIAAFVALWKNCEGFRNFWIGLWEGIKKVCAAAWEAITKWFSDAWKTIKNIWDAAVSFFSGIWNGIKNVFNSVISFFTNIFKGAFDGIKNAFASVTSFFTGVVDKIKGAFTGIKDKFLDVGKNIIDGIWSGIKGAGNWLKEKITGFTGNVSKWFKKAFKIESPSKLMADEVGEYVGEGIGVGVLDSIPKVKKQLGTFTNFVTDNLGNIKSGLNINTGVNGLQTANSGTAKGNTVINAGQTIYFNGNLSRKQLKQLENDNYIAIKRRLKMEGAL